MNTNKKRDEYTSEDIIEVFYNPLHYPEFIAFWDSLTQFEKADIEKGLDIIIEKSENFGYGSCEDEYEDTIENACAVAFEDGKRSGIKIILQAITDNVEEWHIDYGVELDENN